MERITLGRTGLDVSRICYGTWQYSGHWSDFDRDEAVSGLRTALDLGIDFFDTAQAYGFGRSEEVTAEGLELHVPSRREQVVVATKGGLRKEGGSLERDAGAEWLRSGLEESLRHLRTDYIDIYQVHWPDPDTPFEETARTLEQFVEEGKIRFVGVSNFDKEQMKTFEETRRIDTLQPPYHLFRRGVEEDVLPYCRERDIGVFVYGPLAHGLLAGAYDEDTTFPEDDWRSGHPMFEGETFWMNVRAADRLGEVASDLGITSAQLAVAWTLTHPAVHCAIAGSRRPEHIEETAGAAGIELDEEVLQRIETILEDAVMVGGPTPEGTES